MGLGDMNSKALKLFLLGTILTVQGACVSPGSRQHAHLRELPEGLGVGDIVETNTGKVISFADLMANLARVNVIYVGETHTSIEDHQVQLQILKGLYAQNPSLIIAMEMFPREAQPLLDQYASSSMSEEEFLKEVKWDRIWGYPFHLYRNILTWANNHHIKVIGLNAPPEIVSKIARSGLSSLTPAERSLVAKDFHMNDPAHEEYLRQQYHEHLKDHIMDFNTFLEAQLAWEETMAETVAQTLTSHASEEQIVVLIGKGHISDRVGVPKLTYERAPDAYRTIAPIPVDYPGSTADPMIADFVWITDSPKPFHRVRLGAMLRQLPSGEGLKILEILPDSPAAKAGLQKGDILYMLDGNRVTSIDEVHRALSEKMVHELILKRDNEEVSVTVALPL
jgi:uncharacterized iron-regulated protein